MYVASTFCHLQTHFDPFYFIFIFLFDTVTFSKKIFAISFSARCVYRTTHNNKKTYCAELRKRKCFSFYHLYFSFERVKIILLNDNNFSIHLMSIFLYERMYNLMIPPQITGLRCDIFTKKSHWNFLFFSLALAQF